jgi:hypothetical protein
MHDYSRDIMLANAQTEMEASLKKMELNKKVSQALSSLSSASVYIFLILFHEHY